MFKKIFLAFVVLGAVLAARPLFMLATATPLHSPPLHAPAVTPADRARQIVQAALAEQNLPGVSVAVGAGGDIVWAEGFGWADVESRTPVTPDTRFRIGTASSVLTSAAVAALVEQGLLNLDEEIQTHVPQFPKKTWPVTLRQVMGHEAGLATDSGEGGPLSRQRCERPVDAVPHVAAAALLFEPGTQSQHSNYSWILVSAAIEAAAGQPFLTVMREQIFEPLGMDDTGAESSTEENPEAFGEDAEDPPPFRAVHDLILKPWGIGGARAMSATPPIATYYVRGFGPGPVLGHGLHVTHPRNLSCYAGAMAFFSTPSDLVRFGLERLTSGQETRHDGELRDQKVMSLLTFPDRGIVVAVTSNLSDADTATLASEIAEAFAE